MIFGNVIPISTVYTDFVQQLCFYPAKHTTTSARSIVQGDILRKDLYPCNEKNCVNVKYPYIHPLTPFTLPLVGESQAPG